MSTFELNKIAGAVLFTLLVVVGATVLSRMIYGPEEHEREAGLAAEEQPPEGGPVSTAGVEEAPGEAAEAQAPKATPSLPALLAQADVEAGKKAARICATCHTLEKGGANKIGPNLWEVLGGPVAGREGFNYSEALKDLGGAWDYERLAAFIADPRGFAPGTKMTFAGVKDEEERANVIAYLRTFSDSPPPLPEAAEGREEEAEAAAPETAEVEAQETEAGEVGAGEAEADVVEADEAEAEGAEPILSARLADADVEAGKKAARICSVCHTFEKGGANKIGPNLWGVLGRPVASHEGFNYSEALKDLGGRWGYDRIANFIADPQGFAPGTKMTFAGVKDEEERANVIAYLRTFSDSPPPLPEAESESE